MVEKINQDDVEEITDPKYILIGDELWRDISPNRGVIWWLQTKIWDGIGQSIERLRCRFPLIAFGKRKNKICENKSPSPEPEVLRAPIPREDPYVAHREKLLAQNIIIDMELNIKKDKEFKIYCPIEHPDYT